MKTRVILFTLATVFSLTLVTSTLMAAEKQQATPKAQAQTPAPKAQAPAENVPPPNTIAQAAMKAGVKSCAGRINQVTNFLIAGIKDAGAMTFVPDGDPDKQVFSVSMELPLPNSDTYASAYASASVAPNQANGCTGLYETVVYWPQSCTEVGDKQFSSFKKVGVLSKNIFARDDGKSARVFLMPAGKGCVAIKKEIVR